MKLVVIGEMAACVRRDEEAFANYHTEVPWHAIAAMRHLITHTYGAVDVEVVWATVQRNLPSLIKTLAHLIAGLDAYPAVESGE